MPFEQLLYEKRDRVATITLNRPKRLNAWNEILNRELRLAVQMASEDDDVRCIVITGADRAFCAGADMSRLQRAAEGVLDATPLLSGDRGDLTDLRYLSKVAKPLVAAINGPVAGIGVCLAMFCDLRLMAPKARLTTSYARRGVIAEYGIAWMLPRLIGVTHATDLLLSGRTVSAEEAAAMGFASLIPDSDFAANVHERAAQIANLCSPRSHRVIKTQLARAWEQSLPEAMDMSDRELFDCLSSADFREGIAHFLEKRAPEFPGA
ncbi:enoyl-CoA hydratase-related protein [Cupriavidus pinatubonensis]|uniref:enoyl-CoA hydratase-related protein n=1 Tax=Cupriavidus pinatubonensis TaxID=248026 RepID=UPI0036130300